MNLLASGEKILWVILVSLYKAERPDRDRLSKMLVFQHVFRAETPIWDKHCGRFSTILFQ